jgi:phospholipid/cholesterol/gamma-HCH transport system substrate-binding protein
VVAFVLLGGGNPYTVTANFTDASQLVKGNLVEVGGVKAGTVKDISLGPQNTALVEMEIEGDYAPLPEGTVATIRNQSLSSIAGHYVQLTYPQGDQSKGRTIPDGGNLPISSTVSGVDIDQLFNTLDPQTIRHFKDVVTGFARAYDGIGPQANRGFHYFNPFLSTSRQVFNELTLDEDRFRHLIVDSASLSKALAERSPDLEQFVSNADRMFGAIASQNQALASAIGQLPNFMRNFNTTAVNLRATLDDLDPLVSASIPVARKLPPFTQALRGFATESG